MYKVKNVSNNFDFVGMILNPAIDKTHFIVCKSIDIVNENSDNMTCDQIYNCLEEYDRLFLKKDLEEIYD